MKDNKTICKKGKFIDEVFGEEIEYARIYDGDGITIIFCTGNKMVIKRFKNTKEIIEKFIEKYIECDFTDKMWQELDIEFDKVSRQNKDMKSYITEILKYYNVEDEKLCNMCKNMEE